MFKSARKRMFLATGGLFSRGANKAQERGYTSSAQSILKEMGDKKIERIYIKRTPLGKLTKWALNALSLGEFNKRLAKLPFDELYHLRLDIETEDGLRYTLEKNAVITLTRKPKTSDNTESMLLNVPNGTTTNMLLEKTQKRMKQDFFPYSAKNNNCTDFIMGILRANNLDTPTNTAFTKLDTDSLFTDTFRKLTNTVTDVAGGVENVTT